MATKPCAQRQHGVTLIEALIAVVVVAVLATAAVPAMGRWLDTRRLVGVSQQLAGDLQFARTEAVARNAVLRVSRHADAEASCWVLHTGAAAACTCAVAAPAVCSGGALEIRTVWLSTAGDRVRLDGNVASIAFDPLHGTSTPAGTLRLIGADGRAVHHIVNVMGRARTCSPGSAVPRHRPC